MDVSLRKKNTKKNVSNSKNSGVVRNKYGTGVRSYLVNSGLDTKDIGYDQKNNQVTYKGKPVISPNIVVDGTSYADEESLRNLALNIHDDEGTDLVSASDYANQKLGIKNAVTIDDGYVSVGDSIIRANVSSDGNAYVPRSEMENAMAEYELGIDYQSERDIFNNWENNYGAKILNAINELTEETWSYSPEDDPAYMAYADMYKREGLRAYEDAFGNAIANTGGMTNSAALSQAAQGFDYYMQQLTDRVPELMKNDYERYAKSKQVRIDALNSLIKHSVESYKNESEANNNYLNRLAAANEAKYQQSINADKAELDKKISESQIFNNYIEGEKGLIDLEYLPQKYASEYESEILEQVLDGIEIYYKPKLYESDLSNDEIDRALKELEVKYTPDMYQSELYRRAIENEFLWDKNAAEVDSLRRDVNLKDLRAKYFLWK